MTEEEYMRRAIELARKGEGHVSPNPLVGAVIVKEGRIIGEGYHAAYGELHAERNALKNCKESPEFATIYVTLEPCCHQGKQPPCTDALIESGISQVVIGSADPNPKVSGKGIEILRAHGIRVVTGFLKEECDALNPFFFHYITTGKPYVSMKYAMTMDGKIASYTGASKWITGERARHHVHELRKKYSAILVGEGTVIADDPMLNCRIEEGVDPIRVICDSNLRTRKEAKVIQTAKTIPTILATASTDTEKINEFKKYGCQIIQLPRKDESIDLSALLTELGKRGIDSLLIEGGGTISWTFIKEKLVQHIYAYLAPKILGGQGARSPVEGTGFELPEDAARTQIVNMSVFGQDLCIESDVIM